MTDDDIMSDDNPTRVTLRETYSGFANMPNLWRVLGVGVVPTRKNDDDGTGRDVVVALPDGLHIGHSVTGSLEFYDAKQNVCLLSNGKHEGRPMLIAEAGFIPLEVLGS
jgi:hypothetical protein